jgi:phospholipid/cholesterol/gamma-HCH transport system substrate-binding protein
MRKAIRDHLRDFIALVGLVLVALAVGLYILANQGVRFPWEEGTVRLRASFATAQAVVPGQGQTVRIAGVRIGDIEGTELVDGRAIVTFAIDPEYDGLVRRDATALLRPRTGLKDMFVELNPGTRAAPAADEDFVIPVSNTLPDVNPDEFLASLDVDTRAYLRLLLKGAGDGLRGRGEDLREVLRRFGPTYRDLARVTREVTKRRAELRRLVRSLNLVNRQLGGSDDELAELVDSASRSFGTLAARRDDLSGTVSRLPGTLEQATRTLTRVEGMARELEPAATELRAVPPALLTANRAVKPFAEEAAPLLRRDVRPFVRAARPAVGELSEIVPSLARSEPGLRDSLEVLNRLGNMLAHNPRGREAPGPNRDEGFLFHASWAGHQLNSVFSLTDAHGSARKATFGLTCDDFRGLDAANPLAEVGLALTPILTEPRFCGGGAR